MGKTALGLCLCVYMSCKGQHLPLLQKITLLGKDSPILSSWTLGGPSFSVVIGAPERLAIFQKA